MDSGLYDGSAILYNRCGEQPEMVNGFMALTTLQYNSFIREMLLLFFLEYKDKLCATFTDEIIKSVNAGMGYTHSGKDASVITAKCSKNTRWAGRK
jgi:hypothetical protein